MLGKGFTTELTTSVLKNLVLLCASDDQNQDFAHAGSALYN
jgi:hypothetical protein